MKGDAGSKEMKDWWKQTSNEIPTTTTQVLGSRFNSNEAAITSEEDKLSSSSSAFLTTKRLPVDKGKESIAVKAVVTIRRDMRGNVVEKIEDRWKHFVNGLGRGISLQLVSEEIDPETNSGKYAESKVKGWKQQPPLSDDPYTIE